MNFLLIWQEWLVMASVAALVTLLICLIRKQTLGRTAGWLCFAVYITTLICLTILPFPTKHDPLTWAALREGIDLVPIRPLQESWAIVEIYLARGDRSPLHTFLWNNVGNFLVLMPLAVFLKTFFKQTFLRSWLLTLGCSILIELSQALLCIYFGVLYRVIDVNDLILNGLGALLALLVMRFFTYVAGKTKRRKPSRTKRRRQR